MTLFFPNEGYLFLLYYLISYLVFFFFTFDFGLDRVVRGVLVCSCGCSCMIGLDSSGPCTSTSSLSLSFSFSLLVPCMYCSLYRRVQSGQAVRICSQRICSGGIGISRRSDCVCLFDARRLGDVYAVSGLPQLLQRRSTQSAQES